MSKSWRDRAREVIAEVYARVDRNDEAALRKALFDAYPFGERAYTPYKIWLDECKRARLGIREPVKPIDTLTGNLF